MNVQEEKSRNRITLGSDGNALVNLVVVNAVAFVLLKFIYVIYLLSDLNIDAYYSHVFNWSILPANLEKLAYRPWTIVTYMFSHESVMHVIGNLLWLWLFGYILQDLTGNRKLVPVYVMGGLVGGVVFILAHYILPKLQPDIPIASLVGANTAVMAVAIATTTVAPDYRIFPMINGGIPLWILTAAYVIIDFASISVGNVGSYLAHLAGAGMGFLFIYQYRRGRDMGAWLNAFFDWVENLFNPDKPSGKMRAREQHYYKVGKEGPFRKIPHVTQQRIDQILDKINTEGYHMLSEEEKDILRRAANEDDL
ncbi:rhomboid family intramembrane serine protease [Flavihumibacter rivuli]|uniref:rhomboid family intramembrane serine protease n=1 Tax=Flavihumibacter rivuli TaxID=2838156 RepID=UPI001BDE1571|nr:rhomboid family intramembrane serine protease [Flavihumibacter rivuli]ULQ55350.1 rhomboid family intramembrane serine protease [Flavihumibacter rivuli]